MAPEANTVPSKATKAEIEAFGKTLNFPIDLDIATTREGMVSLLMTHMAANGAAINIRDDGTMECVPLPGPSVEEGDPDDDLIDGLDDDSWVLPENVVAYNEALDDIASPYPRDFTLQGVRYFQETADDLLEPVVMEPEESDELEYGESAAWVPLVRIVIPDMKGSGLRALEGMVRGTFKSTAGYSTVGMAGTWEISGALARADECETAAEAVLGTSYGFINPKQFIKRVAPTVAEQEAAAELEAASAAEHAITGE